MGQNQKSQQKYIFHTLTSDYNQKQQSLSLVNCEIWKDVLKCRDWKKLNKFLLTHKQIMDSDIPLIQKVLNEQLEYLLLIDCQLGGTSIRALVNNYLHNLKQLELSNSNIGNLGAKWLSKIQIQKLQKLHIDNCRILGEGFKHLTKSKWPNLTLFLASWGLDSPNANKMQLDGWQVFFLNKWMQLEQIIVEETQAILLMNFVLVQKPAIIDDYFLIIDNQQLKNQVISVISNRVVLQDW